MNKRNEWTFRIKNELKHAESAHFITLTYNESEEPWCYVGFPLSALKFSEAIKKDDFSQRIPTLNKRDLQLFLKRLRHDQDQLEGIVSLTEKNPLKWPKIKYFAVGEYGTKKDRPHYHLIAFNIRGEIAHKIEKIWGIGNVMVVPATPATIHYTTKYLINKYDTDINREAPFQLTSKYLGIKYLHENSAYHLSNKTNVVRSEGVIQKLPRYYTDKLFGVKTKKEIREKTIKFITDRSIKDEIRLNEFHEHPLTYAEEVRQNFNNTIKNKLNEKNKL